MHCQRYTDLSGLTRRQWLSRLGHGVGAAALSSLLRPELHAAALPGLPHFEPKAKRVICLFMSGGLSQLESFDYKPLLSERSQQPLPPSVFKGRQPLGMSRLQANFPIQGSVFPFARHGECGAWFSDRFPHLARQADRLCFLKGMVSEAVNHDPAIVFMNSGHQLPGRPVMGSWLSYGLGSENENLPAFIVMVTRKAVDQPLSTRLWDSAFLPAQHQGMPFRPGKEAVLYLDNPPGLPMSLHRRALDSLRAVQEDEMARRGEAAIQSRIEQFEMAFRMQTSVPEVTSIAGESAATLERYGPGVEKGGTFAHHCLLARRLCEKGVRFVQLYHPGWDHHAVIKDAFTQNALEIDQPVSALLDDLHERGLLSETLVLFVTEFGRTCYSQGGGTKSSDAYGREHHRDAFTFWMAGGGVKPGVTHGATDEFGFDVVEGRVTVNDFHATLLHLLGIEHEKFTYRYQGRDFRLTDVAGSVITPILA